jgi:hypothetical protein
VVNPTEIPVAGETGPKIQFATNAYDFGKVKAGELVKYSYIFTNTGDAVLEVSHVQPSCGCTTAGDWTHKVEPGQTGIVPVQFNSANFNGQVFKTVTVTCNDRTQPSIGLQLKGTIWKPVEVVPQFAVLNVIADAPPSATTVRILNNTDEPMDILGLPEVQNKAFTAELKTNTPGKEYALTITTVPPLTPGNVQSQVTVRTSSTNAPTLTVTAWANVQPVIMVVPPAITLQAGPLAAAFTQNISINNNSTATNITLSEAKVDVPGAEVKILEQQPGKIFTASVTFPQGYEAPVGQNPAVTIKTSHPAYPLIKVPVQQLAKAPQPTVPVAPGAPGAPAAPSPAIQPPPATAGHASTTTLAPPPPPSPVPAH